MQTIDNGPIQIKDGQLMLQSEYNGTVIIGEAAMKGDRSIPFGLGDWIVAVIQMGVAGYRPVVVEIIGKV